MGASLGAIGTARAQYHLRQILVALNLFTLNQPEVVIADAAHRFDENGNLIHEPTKQLIQELLRNLVDWTRRISPVLESTSASRTATTGHPLSGGAPA
jgi:chromate reductase